MSSNNNTAQQMHPTQVAADASKNARIEQKRKEAHEASQRRREGGNERGRFMGWVLPEIRRINLMELEAQGLTPGPQTKQPSVLDNYSIPDIVDALVEAGRVKLTLKFNQQTGDDELAVICVEKDGSVKPTSTLPSVAELTDIVVAYADKKGIKTFRG